MYIALLGYTTTEKTVKVQTKDAKFLLEFSRAEKLLVAHTCINQYCEMAADAFPKKA